MFSQRKSKRTWTILLTAASVILIWGAEARAQGKKYCAVFTGNISGPVSGLNYIRLYGTEEVLRGPATLTFQGDVAAQILFHIYKTTPGSNITLTGSVVIRVFTPEVGPRRTWMEFAWQEGKFTYYLWLQSQLGIVSGSLATSATLMFVNDSFALAFAAPPDDGFRLPYSSAHLANVQIYTMPQP